MPTQKINMPTQMRAAMANLLTKEIYVSMLPMIKARPGLCVCKTLACGICGTDLHTLLNGVNNDWTTNLTMLGGENVDPAKPCCFGHEFVAEICEIHESDTGPDARRNTKKLQLKDRVVTVPMSLDRNGKPTTLGYSNDLEMVGGFAEYVLLPINTCIKVPDHVPNEIAALTEPMSVAHHAVLESNILLQPNYETIVPIVIGLGPVGLAVTAVLKAYGMNNIIGSDFANGRRALGNKLGANISVDPKNKEDPFITYQQTIKSLVKAKGTKNEINTTCFVFECVGVPGMIQNIIETCPTKANVTVVGVCMTEDTFRPTKAIIKQVTLKFVLAYSAEEFAQTFKMICDGSLQCEDMVTGRVGLNGVREAFDILAKPNVHAKILVIPGENIESKL